MILFIIWIILCVIVGKIGSNRNIGFGGAFFLSLLLSPIIGLIITLISKDKEDEKHKKEMLDTLKKQQVILSKLEEGNKEIDEFEIDNLKEKTLLEDSKLKEKTLLEESKSKEKKLIHQSNRREFTSKEVIRYVIVFLIVMIGLYFLIKSSSEHYSNKVSQEKNYYDTVVHKTFYTTCICNLRENPNVKSKIIKKLEFNQMLYCEKDNNLLDWFIVYENKYDTLYTQDSSSIKIIGYIYYNLLDDQITLPKYEIIDEIKLISGEKMGDVLIKSFSQNTSMTKREMILREIAKRKRFDRIDLYSTIEAQKANYSDSFNEKHPDALKTGYLGGLRNGKFILPIY